MSAQPTTAAHRRLRAHRRHSYPPDTTRREPVALQGTGRRPITGEASPTPSPMRGLGDLVRFALVVLADIHRLHPDVVNGHLERTLRIAVEYAHATIDSSGQTSAPADPARRATMRTVCAFLAAGSYEDAYLALLEAETHFPVIAATGSP